MNKRKKEVVEAFKLADKNGDGKIDLEEYIQHFKVSVYTLVFENFW